MKKEGHLDVGDGHEIFYQQLGNPMNTPLIFLHGGPGVGISDKDHRFFDLDKYFVILFDQRGAGRSKSREMLGNNTTDHLVQDILFLMNHFGLQQSILFGGSWGSTLALCFAIKHPERVSGMILRGIFLGTKENRQQFEYGTLRYDYPTPWQRLCSLVPEKNLAHVADFYFHKILEEDFETNKIYAYEWMRYGMSMLFPTVTEIELMEMIATEKPLQRMKVQAHFSLNDFFLPNNFIIENTHRLPDVPIHIIHGKNDLLCHWKFAKRLHKQLPKSVFYLEEAGHTAGSLEKTLVKVLQEF